MLWNGKCSILNMTIMSNTSSNLHPAFNGTCCSLYMYNAYDTILLTCMKTILGYNGPAVYSDTVYNSTVSI